VKRGGKNTVISKAIGTVTEVGQTRAGVQELVVQSGDEVRLALNHINLTGVADVGDAVVINTTATELDLGSGGYDFVIHNLTRPLEPTPMDGHIVRLRYTPLQHTVLAVEEPASPHHEVMQSANSLHRMPVVCCGLHSQIAPVAAAIHHYTGGKCRVVYVMTDSASLALGVSRLVPLLSEAGLLHGVVTVGQAYGGDLEAVNVYSGLLAAKHVLGADAAIVAQGVGNTGTATAFGFSGIDQGIALNAVSSLEGIPIACLRLSFADPRPRHYRVSHHTLTVLSKVALSRCHVPVPALNPPQLWEVLGQLEEHGIAARHLIRVLDGSAGLEVLRRSHIHVTTMGRSMLEDREYFLAAAAAGAHAAEWATTSETLKQVGEESAGKGYRFSTGL
jgi:hypothetical protein